MVNEIMENRAREASERIRRQVELDKFNASPQAWGDYN
jgi:hypothetical protein